MGYSDKVISVVKMENNKEKNTNNMEEERWKKKFPTYFLLTRFLLVISAEVSPAPAAPTPFVLLMLRVPDRETHAPSVPHSCTRARWRWEGVAAREKEASGGGGGGGVQCRADM